MAELVEQGELPPVEDRIPADPFVVGPGTLISEEYLDWEPGQHGGTIRLLDLEGTCHEVLLALGTTILRGPDQESEGAEPALVSEFEMSDDYREFTMTIREGLRWSDGEPVTTEDVRFAFEDIYLNEEVTPAFPAILRSQGRGDGAIPELDIEDDYTFTLRFDESYGFFKAELSSWIPTYNLIFKPAHYLKQYHIDYTAEEDIQPYLDEEELDVWYELVDLKDMNQWDMDMPAAIGVPVLRPWMLTEVTTEYLRYERNPYFHMVDTEGNQLPYVDALQANVVTELEALQMRIIADQADVVTSFATIENMPMYREHEDTSEFRIVMHGSINDPAMLFLNHDYQYDQEDSAWQELVSDPEQRFGRALAYAVNSEEINNSLYFGMNDLPEVTTPEHNPEAAEQLLDEAGMDEFDGDGFRLGPDGEPFDFIIAVAPYQPELVPLAELFREQFQDVGIRVTIDQMDSRLLTQQREGNEHMSSIHWHDKPIWEPGISQDYMPASKGYWGGMSERYFETGGEAGRPYPDYIAEFFDIHTRRKAYPPQSEEGLALYDELLDWFSTYHVHIYATTNLTVPTVVNQNLGNVVKDEVYPYDRSADRGMKQLFFKNLDE